MSSGRNRVPSSSDPDDIVYGFGDSPNNPAPGSFRIYFQNVNGLKLHNNNHLTETVGFLRSFNASAVCLAETNVNWNHPVTYDTVDRQLRLAFGHARIATSSSGIRTPTTYQAGGTLTALLGKWCGRKLDAGRDLMGSFSWMRLRGRRGRKITIISCYRVVQSSGAGLGDATAFVQQETVLRDHGVANPNPRVLGLQYLEVFVKERSAAEEEVILSIDANETTAGSRGQLANFVRRTGLIDAVASRHSNPPRTCIKGNRRIDYIFISPTLSSALLCLGHIGLQDAIFSDHCGIWLDFEAAILFRGPTQSLSSVMDAPFTLRETKKVEKYISVMEAHLRETNVEKRLDALRAAASLPLSEYRRIFEGIQNDVDVAMKAGIKAVRKRNIGFARSPALTKAASIVRFWRTQLSVARNQSTLSKASMAFASLHDLPGTVQPLSIIFRRLHQAWANLRLVQKHARSAREEWLDELAEEAAVEMNTTKEVALKQMAFESRVRRIYSKLKPISKGTFGGALASIKIPLFEWFFHTSSDMLYHYVRGAFYAHSRVPGIDNNHAPFRMQHTRRPLPSKDVVVARVTQEGNYFILHSTQNVDEIWTEVTDSEEIETLLLDRNADHLRQCTVDHTPFAVPPLHNLFGKYGTNENADRILDGSFPIDDLPLNEESKSWLRELTREDDQKDLIDTSFTPEDVHKITRACNPRTSASPSDL